MPREELDTKQPGMKLGNRLTQAGKSALIDDALDRLRIPENRLRSLLERGLRKLNTAEVEALWGVARAPLATPLPERDALCFHLSAQPCPGTPRFAACPDCKGAVMSDDIKRWRERWVEWRAEKQQRRDR